MKRRILLIVAMTMGLSTPLWAQTALNQVRLTEPITSSSQATVTHTAGTDAFAVGDVVYIDREVMVVLTVVSTTLATVARGQMGTRADLHADDAIVWTGTARQFYYTTPSGRCTTTTAYPGGRRPWINVISGEIAYCDDNVYGLNAASYWRITSLDPSGAAGRVPYTVVAYRSSRNADAGVILPAYSVLLTDVLVASLTYSGPFEIFLPSPTGLLGKHIMISDVAGLNTNFRTSTAGRTISIRGLFENGDNTKTLAAWQDLEVQPGATTSQLVGAFASTTYFVGITSSSMYYWFSGGWR